MHIAQQKLENALPHCIRHDKNIEKIIILSWKAKSLNFIKIGEEKKRA